MTLPMSSCIAQRFFVASGLALLPMLAIACATQLPPAPMPRPVVPPVAATLPAPAPGHGRIVVDVANGGAPVHRVLMKSDPVANAQGLVSFRFYQSAELLCDPSPCVLDIPFGNVLLGFPVIGDRGMETELLHAGPQPTVYRRALSKYDRRSKGLRVLGIVGTTFGGMAAITGATLLPVGLGKDSDGLRMAGGISLVAGAVLTAAGIWAIRRGTSRYRPGSSIQFPLPAR